MKYSLRWIAALVFCLAPLALQADTLETVYLRGSLSPAELTPPVEVPASANATITMFVRRDAEGDIVSAVADFSVDYDVQNASWATSLNIHRGGSGQNGASVIAGGLTPTAPVVLEGVGRLATQAVIATVADREALSELLEDPAGFYVILRTAGNPEGLMRGQLTRMQRLSTNADLGWDANLLGAGSVEALYVSDASGTVTDGVVRYHVTYDFYPDAVTILGAHIHQGENGPPRLQSNFPYSDPIEVVRGKGSATFTVHASSEEDVAALQALVDDPESFFLNLHVGSSPESAGRNDIDGRLKSNPEISYTFPILPGNVVPAAPLNAWGLARVTVSVSRDEDDTITAGVVDLDATYQFPGPVTFQGIHVHEGMAGVNARYLSPTKLGFPARFTDADGGGAVHIRVNVSPTDAGGLEALAGLLDVPAGNYLDVHTTDNPKPGALRGQIVGPVVEPVISEDGIVNATLAEGTTVASPGSLISIFGTNLSQATVGAVVKNGKLATNASGTEVTIGGIAAPILHASPGQLNVQTPVGLNLGEAEVKVTTVWGTGAPLSLLISNTSPGIFAVVKASNFTLVTADNRVAPGETVIVFATGLGIGAPPLSTGQLAPSSPLSFTATTPIATIGGIGATVTSSVMAPGMAGVQQVNVVVPGGAASGAQELTLSADGVASNSKTIYVR